jgi:NAD(P)-dependent dehydrogenase (short-subunit alcohol dehydrogenase family)
MADLEKPVALITGASRGLGREVALALTRAGWRVVATARSQKALEELDDEVRALGGEATLVPLDIKDYDGLDRLGAALYERFGRLDGLVANAGVLGDLTPVAQARPAMITDVYSANLIANHRLIRAMDPLLRAAPAARAVFVSSIVAHEARAFWGAYAASKAALEMLVSCYAAEIAITKIKVNCIDPGPVRTLMRAKAFPGEDPNTLPTPQEVARLFVELLSPDCTKHGELVNYRTWKA